MKGREKFTERERKELERLDKKVGLPTAVDLKYYERVKDDDTIDTEEGFNKYQDSYRKAKGGEKSKRSPDKTLMNKAKKLMPEIKKKLTNEAFEKINDYKLHLLLKQKGFQGSRRWVKKYLATLTMLS